jgi:hypothetical protein
METLETATEKLILTAIARKEKYVAIIKILDNNDLELMNIIFQKVQEVDRDIRNGYIILDAFKTK